MSKIDFINKILAHGFPKLKDSLEITQVPEIFIIDYKNDGCFIVKYNEKNQPFIQPNGIVALEELDHSKLFTIKNVRRLALIRIDGRKGIIGFGTSQCDFVFFDENDFSFVEFKLNATSSQPSAISKNREKAVSQLLNTINEFDTKLSKNYHGLNLEAYVCSPDFYPRLNASWQALAEDFLEQHGIPLFEQSGKTCK